MTGGVDWLALRRTLVRMARNHGWGHECEDKAQEALARTFGAQPRDPEAYAVVCLKNLGAPEVAMHEAIDPELVGVAPSQHELAERSQQRFLLRVAVTLCQLGRSSGQGGAARIARLRVRRAVEALVGTRLDGTRVGTGLARTPPGFKSGVGPSGAGSPHAGRGRGKKPTVVAESERG